MQVIPTAIPDVKIITPKVFRDDRGFFMESYNAEKLKAVIGEGYQFVQDNHSHSVKNVLRGLHYQLTKPQGKLIKVVKGEIFDVAVDLRRHSKTFGQVISCYLSEENQQMLWVPPQFAHGFLVLSEEADVLYKTTDFYDPSDERCLRWDDPDIAIAWPLKSDPYPLLSAKDARGTAFKNAEVFEI